MADRALRDDIGKTIDHRYRIGDIPEHSSPLQGKRRSARLQGGRGNYGGSYKNI